MIQKACPPLKSRKEQNTCVVLDNVIACRRQLPVCWRGRRRHSDRSTQKPRAPQRRHTTYTISLAHQFPGSPNANSFFGPWPEKVPLPQNTMPSEIDAPALHGAPVSYDQRMAPVLAFIATILPMPGARLQPKTTSFVALTAPSARLPFGSLVVQITASVRASSAAHPPALVVLPSFSCQGIAPVPPPARAVPL